MTGEKSFTLPVFALILLSFILGTSEFVIIGILPDIAAGIDCSIVMIVDILPMPKGRGFLDTNDTCLLK
ncbi:hypothetical protein B5F82_10155 [Megamonas hypermegale]|uniref:MFS transporter n=1 Tax=Megamonas hypermegale TaxID=158847 RepID=UPI000B36C163|nr:MFS transporter [Megamonas hypermegale]OUO37614.1 hypothetical protein B5F82_10155 [Megamonas hypermegale]